MSSEQFLRTSRLIGESSVDELHNKKVLIVGMGAVGSLCLESLARSGVGFFRIIDFDVVSVSNINRQIIASWDTLDRSKVDVAKERVLAINPKCKVETIHDFFTEAKASTIIDNSFDLVIDAIDALNPKCDLLTFCYLNNIKVISSMGAALRREPTLVQSADLFDTYGCPLAKLLRKRLRHRGVERGIKVVFSPEQNYYEFKEPQDENNLHSNEQILHQGRERKVLGSLATITGIFALHLAHLALKELLVNCNLEGHASINYKEKQLKSQN